MKMLRCLVVAFMLAPSVLAHAASWTLQDGSAIRFTCYQQGAPVMGGFDRFTAEIAFDPDDLAQSRVEVEIETASVSTGHKDRDAIVRSPNLLDVERWPAAHFTSAAFEQVGGDAYQARGQLTIRDVAKDVVLPFTLRITDQPGDAGLRRADARGELTISRLDYGVGQGEWASTVTIGEKVVIAIEIVASARP